MNRRSSALKIWTAFAADKSGTLAVVFATTLIPVTVALGAAVDYSRASSYISKLQAATDATLLSIAPTAKYKTDQQVAEEATRLFKARIDDTFAKVDRLEVSPARTELKLYTSTSYKTAFAAMAGVQEVGLAAYSKVIISNTTYEIALVMDNSGSMASSAGGKSKMDAAKEAAKSLVNTMLANDIVSERTKISLVPFTLSVSVGSQYRNAGWLDHMGTSSIHWQNLDRSSSWKPQSRFALFDELNVAWGGCVETRPGTWATSDAAPSFSDPDSYFVPQFAPDEPGVRGSSSYSFTTTTNNVSTTTRWTYPNSYLDDNPSATCGATAPAASQVSQLQSQLCKYRSRPTISTSNGRGPNYNCSAKPLTRLTNDKTALTGKIDQMVANGNTNLLEGFMWGWRTLSPNVPFADGKSYSEPNAQKIIILLTDGMNVWGSQNNHNKSVYAPFGYYGDNRLSTIRITNQSNATTVMDVRTLEACNKAKAANIQIYTVGFSTPDDPINSAGLNLLRNCATRSSMAYVANDASSIVSVFDEIARNIGTLRVAE